MCAILIVSEQSFQLVSHFILIVASKDSFEIFEEYDKEKEGKNSDEGRVKKQQSFR